MVEGPGFVEGQTGIYVKDITEGGPAQKVLQPFPGSLKQNACVFIEVFVLTLRFCKDEGDI